ncbi:Aste57867_19727 [Aphanomyces stellatus]|uniref:Aste57867_19727 protein n=1 Tax=Aphanomyces stellatus TaxID=120398 RepID=A0A485LF34_9STRA|nr:hypothetical protein As57867_019662 [Aphanomyces stellatus]VFT96425.1 Aste57867_19727 [Aphanomyces stellatus]
MGSAQSSRRPRSALSLPPELVQCVACFLPDAATFFRLLEALRPSLLEDLQFRPCRLGGPNQLWSRLRLSKDTLPVVLPLLNRIQVFYSGIEIADEIDVACFGEVIVYIIALYVQLLFSRRTVHFVSKM